MPYTSLSSKGQVIIPKPIRTAHHWEPGQKLAVIDVGDGILLKAENAFPATTLDEVTSCLKYTGKRKSLAEMEAAIRQGVEESARDCG